LDTTFCWDILTNIVLPVTSYWSACAKSGKWAVMYLCVRSIEFAFLRFVYWISEMFRKRSAFWFSFYHFYHATISIDIWLIYFVLCETTSFIRWSLWLAMKNRFVPSNICYVSFIEVKRKITGTIFADEWIVFPECN
jgi:hypothetical protein